MFRQEMSFVATQLVSDTHPFVPFRGAVRHWFWRAFLTGSGMDSSDSWVRLSLQDDIAGEADRSFFHVESSP